VVVQADAQKSDADQHNANLLLSENAEIDTQPQLEIYADDVKCSHGATVGQLDDDALFYLQSRGLDYVTARDLLIYGFAAEVLTHIDDAALQKFCRSRLLACLPKALTTIKEATV
jgi:Fe-S cluster assembly protein SufD